MVHLYKDLYIGADTYCYILMEKKIVKEKNVAGKKTREDAVGSTKFVQIGFYKNLDALLKSAVNMCVMREVETTYRDIEITELAEKVNGIVDDFRKVLDSVTAVLATEKAAAPTKTADDDESEEGDEDDEL